MPAKQHFATANTKCTIDASPTAGVVTYTLDGTKHTGPDIDFTFGANPGDVRHLSIMFVGPDGSTCPVDMKFGTQTDFDFLSAVTGAPPDVRDHDFVTAASRTDVTNAVRFRRFELTGRMPAAPKKAKKAKKAGGGK